MEWTPSRIRLLRAAGLCLSQQEFAKTLGFAKRTIGNAERGTHPPSLAVRRALDQALEQASDAQRERFCAALAADHGTHPVVHPTTAALESVELLRPRASTVEQVEELLAHLRAQWHLFVKTDNLFGPRYALSGVLLHVQLLDELLVSARASARTEFVTLAAQYAESAAWLYEDSDDLAAAATYNSRAMEWAHEAGDHLLVAWTLFRRSQQATYRADAARVVGLSQAARRNAAVLTPPMCAAIAAQEAHGYALDGDEAQAQRLLDQSHQWAATDTAGDAREGHGSFCTATYIELQRAACWLRMGNPQRAIELYETTLPILPSVCRRDRGVALSWCAMAHLAAEAPEQAAGSAREALQIAHSVGSVRTVRQVRAVGRRLTPYRGLAPVGQLLDELATTAAS